MEQGSGVAITSKRIRKIWFSVGATLIGTVLLAGFIIRLESYRDTDLGDSSENITATSQQVGDLQAPPIHFTDVSKQLQVTMRHGPGPRHRSLAEDTGSGLAWGDFDADGDWDLYIVNFPDPQDPASDGSNRLYRNDGDKFVDVTEQCGVGDASGFGMGAWFIDYDNDGDQDLFVTNHGPNRLFQNQGDGRFIDVASSAGVADPFWSTGAAFGDFNRDGHLDIFVCNYVEFFAPEDNDQPASGMGAYSVPFTLNPNSFDPQPNRLYLNRGDGTFVDVAVRCAVDDPEGRSLSATFCDFDCDGWLDLYVNNDVSTNRLFRNPGLKKTPDDNEVQWLEVLRPFEDHSTASGTADPRGSMGLSIGEFGFMTDAVDRFPDIFISHWIAQENALYQSTSIAPGELLYLDKTRQVRLAEISLNKVGWGCAVVDFDLDGLPDIAVANGSTLEKKENPILLESERLFLFWNGGNRFLNVADSAGETFSQVHNARGLAAADFDADGDIDFAVSINRGQPLLLRNDTETDQKSLTIRLQGAPAVCFGAVVELIIDDKPQFRWYGCDVSFLSMHATDLLFGLGNAPQADMLIVHWADGKTSTVKKVSPGRITIDYTNADSQ